MSLRKEFVHFAKTHGNIQAACRAYGISRKTGYKWLARQALGQPLDNCSTRPHRSPTQTPPQMQQRVIQVRQDHPAWGGRKIAHVLRRQGIQPPAPSTITQILRRNNLLDPATSGASAGPWKRFEHEQPNDLWQLDFKGHVPMGNGRRCHPLTALDDHSRFALVLAACGDEQRVTVTQWLTAAFVKYGLPRRILCDNAPPWGDPNVRGFTQLEVWLMRLGVRTIHGRPVHPQTQGKEERFHRTLKAECLGDGGFADLAEGQRRLDRFREVYNFQRPHEALGLKVPADRYRPSPRQFPRKIAEPEYPSDDLVRRVTAKGMIHLEGRLLFISEGLCGLEVAVRATASDGVKSLWLGGLELGRLDLRAGERAFSRLGCGRSAPCAEAGKSPPESVTHVPERV